MTDVAYIDTSCLLKLLVLEPDSGQVARSVYQHDEVVVSSLAELEVRSQLLGLRRGGSLRYQQHRAALKRFDALLGMDPFRFVALGGDVFDAAIAQTKQRGAVHCRSLDRLHLAAMSVHALSSLMTTDRQQSSAARALGFTVIAPS